MDHLHILITIRYTISYVPTYNQVVNIIQNKFQICE